MTAQATQHPAAPHLHPFQPHTALLACPQLWGIRDTQSQEWVQLC